MSSKWKVVSTQIALHHVHTHTVMCILYLIASPTPFILRRWVFNLVHGLSIGLGAVTLACESACSNVWFAVNNMLFLSVH